MKLIRTLRRGLRAVAPPSLFLLLTAYFIWNALHGAHGIKAYHEQLKLKDQALQALQDAHDEQAIWRQRVTALNEKALDTDMLEERARIMLNMSRDGDLIIPYEKDKSLNKKSGS